MCPTGGGGPARSSPLPQRCLPGRSGRMLPQEATTEEGGATSSTPRAVEGEDATGEAEGEGREGATTRVGEEEEATGEEATRATFKTLATTAVEDTTTATTRMGAGTTRGVGGEGFGEGGGVVAEEEEAGEEEGGRV